MSAKNNSESEYYGGDPNMSAKNNSESDSESEYYGGDLVT